MNGLDSLYREVILDHHRSPRNYGPIEGADAVVEGFNPLCGDRVEIFVKVDGPKLSACHFRGEGCSICMASASMMTEEVTGKSLEQVAATIHGFRSLMRGEACPFLLEGDLESLLGVKNFPVRIKCALLPWTTLSDAISKLGGKK
ncbi:MAG: SUF system NifU family Fe-S cluster assembly protein [Bdellovibrionales bacterium]|nr:SUF system NifU family Fe-S cluster assembly protein [Bdellovibrionales bacterium]